MGGLSGEPQWEELCWGKSRCPQRCPSPACCRLHPAGRSLVSRDIPRPHHGPVETKAWSPGSPRSPWPEQSPRGIGCLSVECWGFSVPAPLGKGMCPSHSPMYCCKAWAAGKSLWRGRNSDGFLESWGGCGREALSSHGSDGGQRPQLIWERCQRGHCSLPSCPSGPTRGTRLFLHGIIARAGSGAGWSPQC